MDEPNSEPTSRAEALFDDYLRRRDAGEKTDISTLCEAHPEHADELRSLLRENEILNRLLPGPLDEVFHSAPVSPGELLNALRRAGPRGAQYQRLGEVARGGMGVVLRVWDAELRRTLAMKVVKGRGAHMEVSASDVDPTTLARFLEEAQITSQLDHPGIVPVHEIGLGSDGVVYYTMRLVDGVNLRTIFEHVRTRNEGWNPVRALGVMLKVCEAMSYAHSQGVIHRDLKPANIMVGMFGEVYVMDWGLARAMDRPDIRDLRVKPESSPTDGGVNTERRDQRDSSPDSPLVTMDGEVLGTPIYMSPEQAHGQIEKLGPRSDVYSVGAMLYELIGGRAPFVPLSGRVSSHSIHKRVRAGPPEPLHEIARGASAELVSICEKAMARDIADRYIDMQSLADDLRAYTEGRVVSAHETGIWAESRKWIRRNKALAASLAAALLILAVGIGIGLQTVSLTQDREESDDVKWAMQRLEDFCHQSNDSKFAESRTDAYGWWLDDARELIDGREGDTRPRENRGLIGLRRLLEEVRNKALATDEPNSGQDPLFDQHSKELETKRLRLRWYQRMLGREAWPPDPTVEAALADGSLPPNASAKAINYHVWALVDPRDPKFGAENRALVLAKRAVELTPVDSSPDDPSGWVFRETLTWALHRRGFHDEALALRAEVARKSRGKIWGATEDIPRMEDEVEDWKDGTATRVCDALANEVEALEKAPDPRTLQFKDVRDRLWHDLLNRLVADLERLSDHVKQVESTANDPDVKRQWETAIKAISGDPRFRGETIRTQLDLVPIDADPTTKLWEFAHLPTGEPARGRDSHGKLRLTRETGLVFVLLPGGSITPQKDEPRGEIHNVKLRPYFISKYEMTQSQWTRLEDDWPGRFWIERTLMPANYVSWDDCKSILEKACGWLRLPSEAEWEFACRASAPGRNEPWWTVTTPTPLPVAENVLDASHTRQVFLNRVGKLGANPFGLFDVGGNLKEWCQNPYNDTGDPVLDGLPVFRRLIVGSFWGSSNIYVEKYDDRVRRDAGFPPNRAPSVGLRPVRSLTR